MKLSIKKVGFLSNFTNIYVGRQNKSNLKIIKTFLKKNLSNKNYYGKWRLVKKNNKFFYKDKINYIPINNKNINSFGLMQNIAMAIKIALDLGIKKNIIIKAIPKIFFEGRIQFLNNGKLSKKLRKREKLLIDGCHSEVSGKNLSNFFKNN